MRRCCEQCRGDHWSPPYGGMGDKRYERATPQSTTLTAPLKGSHTECVVCRKSLLEAGCHGVIGKRDVEAPSCTNAYLLFLCGRPMIAPTEGREYIKDVRATPQSTALTAPLNGSHTECVVCRKSLLEAGCHGVIGKRDVEAPSCTNAYLLFLCGRPMIAPTEGRE